MWDICACVRLVLSRLSSTGYWYSSCWTQRSEPPVALGVELGNMENMPTIIDLKLICCILVEAKSDLAFTGNKEHQALHIASSASSSNNHIGLTVIVV
jgi:hypothetical protein